MSSLNWPAPAAGASTRRQLLLAASVLGGLTTTVNGAASGGDGVSRTAETIHHEPVFKASRQRIYDALTDAKQFQKVVELSGAAKSMGLGSKPAEISQQAGGTFALFGGYITGRHIELSPYERIVQAWRPGEWSAGVYSIAKFELVELGASSTKIVFDHTGFPAGKGASLAAGWKANYWEPLTKYLG
jgi:activator of HSP90 ATPase